MESTSIEITHKIKGAIIERLRERSAQESRVVLAFLLGSRDKERANAESDIGITMADIWLENGATKRVDPVSACGTTTQTSLLEAA